MAHHRYLHDVPPPEAAPIETAEVMAERRYASRVPARLEGPLLALVVAAPAVLAVILSSNAADAAHDLGLIRTVGLGWTGAFRALDAPAAALFMALPLGTRAFRAALSGAALSGAAGAAIYGLSHASLAPAMKPAKGFALEPSPGAGPGWLRPVLAAIASLAVTLAPSWQLEATAPGGSTLGALLTFLPALAFRHAPAIRAASAHARTRAAAGLSGLTWGLALGYEPLVGLSALVALGAYGFEPRMLAELWRRRERADLALVGVFGSFAGLGLVPFLFAFGRSARAPALAVPGALGASLGAAAGERGESGAGVLTFFLRDEVGGVVVLLALVGAGLALGAIRAGRNRRPLLALLSLALTGALALALGAPAGPTRYGAPVLALFAAIHALAAVALRAGIARVARAKVPLATALSACVVLLASTLPVRAADEALTREAARHPEGTAERPAASRLWDQSVWGALPAGAVVLEGAPRVVVRLLAARAGGGLPAGLVIVPIFDLGSPLALHALAHEPALVPYFRDRALVGAPAEASLSGLAASRSLIVAFDPTADRRLAFHLLPRGIFLSFEPDARGASDRRQAFEASAGSRNRLFDALVSPLDPELVTATESLARGAALAFAATGDRDLSLAALGDVRRLAPGDPFAEKLARRLEASAAKGTAVDLTSF